MPKFLKNIFEKEGRKGIYAILAMLALGAVLLLVSAQLAGDGGDGGGISILPLSFDAPEEQAHDLDGQPAQNAIASSLSLSAYLTQQLEEILSLVAGAGEVRVMLTMGNASAVFAQNTQENAATVAEEDGEGGVRNTHTVNSSITYVMVRQSDGSEVPLALTEVAPAIEGIIIVAQGGGSVAIVDALTRAAQAALDIAPHRIQVLEMKQN